MQCPNYKVVFVIVAVITIHNVKLTAVPTPDTSMAQSTFREIAPFELEVEAEIQVESEPYIELTKTSYHWMPTACRWPAPWPGKQRTS